MSRRLVYEFAAPVEGLTGRLYQVRAYGSLRANGMWVGSLDFLPEDGSPVVCAPNETEQSSLRALVGWASRLEPTYFDGALDRALRNAARHAEHPAPRP